MVVRISPTNQDLSNDTTFSQIKSLVPVPLIHGIIWKTIKMFTGLKTFVIITGGSLFPQKRPCCLHVSTKNICNASILTVK